LPTVHFGQHEVTRLVCGSNPFYGYSHFNRLFSRHMIEWMTPERVISVLKQCERNGIGSWQTGCRERNYSDLQRYRAEGGKMNVFFLAHGGMVRDVKQIRTAAKFGPVGIAYHGGVTDAKFRDGRMEEVHDFLKTVHDAGVLAGISCHNPAVIEYVEDKGWEVDYYQACFYRVTRTHEEIVRELGEAPVGELYLERDPERMTRVIRQTRRPCLGFKILAAGRKTDSREQVAAAFQFAFSHIKPTDAVIVGMYPRYSDQVRENADLVRRIAREIS